MPRWLLLCLLLLGCVAGCDETDAGTTPSADTTLPPLKLTDETPELLLTWVDERGVSHTGADIPSVPDGSKDMVRVVTRDAGHGAVFYVADLSHKNEDGTYAVKTMTRTAWEEMIAKRREAYRAQHAPPPVPTPSQRPGSAPDPAPATDGSISAIVYGAAWCKPCHQATAHLKRRGVQVVEYDIEKDKSRGEEMQRKLRAAGISGGTIPVIDVGGIILRGYSPQALDNAIKKAGPGGTAL